MALIKLNIEKMENKMENGYKSEKQIAPEQSNQDFGNLETLLIPSRLYAVKFADNEEGNRGAYYILTQTQGVGLSGGILIVRERDLKMLDKIGAKYEAYLPKTNCSDEIYEHFGIKIEPEKSSLINRILEFFGI